MGTLFGFLGRSPDLRHTCLGHSMSDHLREEFVRQLGLRTKQVAKGFSGDRPVCVIADSTVCRTLPGQHLLMALCNLLARVHSQIRFVLRDSQVRLKVKSLVGDRSLSQALATTAARVNPYVRFRMDCDSSRGGEVRLGVGSEPDLDADVYVGASGWVAETAWHPVALGSSERSLPAACLAAVLGSAAVFRLALGEFPAPTRVSAWSFGDGSLVSQGPDLQTLPTPDPGRVLMVGAGAVASALVYWLRSLGVGGEWVVVDPDIIEISNLNRSMLFLAEHVGWPSGPARAKAEVVAEALPSGRPEIQWFDKSIASTSTAFDLVLALANERGVRELIARRGAPVVLHATTGQTWLSQLHRHVLGVDDCIGCRLPSAELPKTKCSTILTGDEDRRFESSSPDAALPFLSAGAGLMLASLIVRLTRGELMELPRNTWRWDFHSDLKFATAGRHYCRDGCDLVPPLRGMREVYGSTSWVDLVPERQLLRQAIGRA